MAGWRAGDSYICLHTVKAGDALARSIHFWLGKDTTKDESGAAALLSVALDDMFGAAATQHREVQGAESADFRQLFAKGLMYLDGGVESSFTKVERDKYATRLLHVKGRRFVCVTQVPAAVASLNSGDVFILDQGLAMFQWNGRGASRREKAKALDAVVCKSEGSLAGSQLAQAGRRRGGEPSSLGLRGVAVVA